MKKNNPIKIRRTWTRHPAEKIKPNADKISNNPCEGCKYYLTDPEACIWCSFDESEQVGGA